MNIGIAGAGLVGRLLAYKLSQLGWNITLFDQDDYNGHLSCGYIAAGMLSPYAELEFAETIIFELGQRSMLLWQQWLSELKQPDILQQRGSLLISHRQDEAELSRFLNLLSAKINTDDAIQPLNDEQLVQLEPDLTLKDGRAYYLPNEGHINTVKLFSLLKTYLIRSNVKWNYQHQVDKVSPGKIIVGNHSYSFDWTFDCRGFGAKHQLNNLRGVRGEIIHLYAPEVHITRPVRLMHPRYPLYIVPRSDNIYVIGATSIESEDSSPISVRSTLELLSGAFSVHSGFAEARVVTTYVNCRPAFLNNLPKVSHNHGMTVINGLYRHGYLIAPALIEMCINELIERKLLAQTKTVELL